MICSYCGTKSEGVETCKGCGASLVTVKPKSEAQKYGPLFYNGYLVYLLVNGMSHIYEYQFWLGPELVERIEIDREILREFVPEYCDPMPFIWKLFLVAHGEEKVIEWQEKNGSKYPAMFEIRRVENPDLTAMRFRIQDTISK